jgi:hypothetical protein
MAALLGVVVAASTVTVAPVASATMAVTIALTASAATAAPRRQGSQSLVGRRGICGANGVISRRGPHTITVDCHITTRIRRLCRGSCCMR